MQSKYLKNRKGYEPLFGEPRFARLASISVQGGAKRRRNGRQNSRKFDTGAFIQPNPSLF